MSQGTETDLVADLLSGDHRALARVISKIEDRAPGYRTLVSRLHAHTGDASIVGITGSPGAGKSTLVDKLAKAYRDRGDTVGVIAVDPSSPYSGGAVLGDRIRMSSNVGDMDVFFRSMSARGQLGGLSGATGDAIKALDAFGKDRILVETVGAGQNEVDIVETADTVAVLVQPGSGDDVQMLKAGILEIGDVFVVNKADMDGADRTVAELQEMLHMRESPTAGLPTGHHGVSRSDAGSAENPVDGEQISGEETGEQFGDKIREQTGEETEGKTGEETPGKTGEETVGGSDGDTGESAGSEWSPVVIETVATTGDGIEELLDQLDAHYSYLEKSGELEQKTRDRYVSEIETLLRNDLATLVERELENQGGVESLAKQVASRETDPYSVAETVIEPIENCLDETTRE